METERNKDKEMCANQQGDDKLSEWSAEKVCEKVNVDEMKENISPQNLNDNSTIVDKYVRSALEKFELDIQRKRKIERNDLLEEQRSTIKGHVTWRTLHTLYIDIKSSKTKPEFVDSVLSAVDAKVQIKHQWRRNQRYPSLWEGAVAVFENPQNARKARIRLSKLKYLTIVPVHEILDVLIEAEIRYPDSRETSTVLIIRAKEPLPQKMKQRISAQLRGFGQVTDLKFQPHINPGEICRAVYRYASHALFAKLICDQSNIQDVGRVSVEVILNRKETRLMEYMRSYIRQK